MDLSIIIVNYKTPDLTLNCINAIESSKLDLKYEIIVVDNASGDNSEYHIKNYYPTITWIQNSFNIGFGRANNIGVNCSKGEFILLINSDVTVFPNTIDTCVDYLKRNPKSVVSCTILNSDNSPQNFTSTVADFRLLLESNILYSKLNKRRYNYKLEAVMGSFMVFQKDVFLKIGGFDPDFFMYSEEVELCWRFIKNKSDIVLINDVYVKHLNGGSIPSKTWACRQSHLSSALLFLKVHGYFGYVAYHFIMLFNLLTNLFLVGMFHPSEINRLWKDLVDYLINCPIYFQIPFMYSTQIGTGKRLLKYK